MIPDPQVLAAHLGASTLVLIVGGERPFLVAVTGSPETKARMVAAYRQAGLPVQVAADADPANPSDHEHQPPQADGRLDPPAQGISSGPWHAEARGPRSGRPEESQPAQRSRIDPHSMARVISL
jgi:hypothetical protein